MNTISAVTGRCILLGKYGDNAVTGVKFDVSEIRGKYGAGGTFLLINQRAGDANGYPVNGISVDGDSLTWTVASSDLTAGSGRVQLQYTRNGAVLHTEIWDTYCGESISGTGTVPSPWAPWVTQITAIKDAAVAAAGHFPYIDGTTGNWFVWDVSGGAFVDSGIYAKGETGATGATGAKGEKGDKGDTGAAGSDAAVNAANVASAGAVMLSEQAAKTTAMTQSVGADVNGKLWVEPYDGSGKLDKPVAETYTVAASAWTSMSGNEPFGYSTEITATHTIGTNTVCELVNNNAVAFAKYGFAIGDIAGQSMKLFAMALPSESVTLEVDYYG